MITEYICEKCKSRYKTKEEAKKCENSHLKAENLMIDEAMYFYKSDRFPTIVTLSTKDGEKQVYKKYFEGEDDGEYCD